MHEVYRAARENFIALVESGVLDEKISNIAKGTDHKAKIARDRVWSEPKLWTCMYPGCSNKAIGSHTLQARGTLKIIGEEGRTPNSRHLVTPQWSPFSEHRLTRSDVSIDEESKFPGFCKTHDTSIFRDLEAEGVQLDIKLRLTQAYRTFCRELRQLHHQVTTLQEAHAAIREAERQFLVEIFLQQIPEEHRSNYPKIKDMNVELNSHRSEPFFAQLSAQQNFLGALEDIEATFSRFVVDDRSAPEISGWFFTLEGDLPFALSGSDDISRVSDYSTPILYFAMPMGGVTELGIFTASEHEDALLALLTHKNLVDCGVGADGSAVIGFFEQVLFDRTDHWFMRPSTWSSMSESHRSGFDLAPLN